MGQSQLAGLPGLHQSTQAFKHFPSASLLLVLAPHHTALPCIVGEDRDSDLSSTSTQLLINRARFHFAKPTFRPARPQPKPHVLRLDHHRRQTRRHCCALAWTACVDRLGAPCCRCCRPPRTSTTLLWAILTFHLTHTFRAVSHTYRTFGLRLPPAPGNAF
ncbi:hypothetical protein K456DRAFT_303503 [Colletotrichum gloeosporioides 23]|nr:hypothetical protein K456DRAFT_303503 [Colletotrichum gloeosporioides 23]